MKISKNINEHDFQWEALIIAEITGSITSGEQQLLDKCRTVNHACQALSDQMHAVLDAYQSKEMADPATHVQKIFRLAKSQESIQKFIKKRAAAAGFSLGPLTSYCMDMVLSKWRGHDSSTC